MIIVSWFFLVLSVIWTLLCAIVIACSKEDTPDNRIRRLIFFKFIVFGLIVFSIAFNGAIHAIPLFIKILLEIIFTVCMLMTKNSILSIRNFISVNNFIHRNKKFVIFSLIAIFLIGCANLGSESDVDRNVKTVQNKTVQSAKQSDTHKKVISSKEYVSDEKSAEEKAADKVAADKAAADKAAADKAAADKAAADKAAADKVAADKAAAAKAAADKAAADKAAAAKAAADKAAAAKAAAAKAAADKAKQNAENSKSGYINSCLSISFDELQRYPSKYKGKSIYICGCVESPITLVQGKISKFLDGIGLTSSDDTQAFFLKDAYGNRIAVIYSPSRSNVGVAQVGDAVTVYGMYNGLQQFSNNYGKYNSPQMTAKYVE